MYAMYFLLYGQPSDLPTALSMSRDALSSETNNAYIQHVYAYSLLFNNQYDDAVAQLKAMFKNSVSKPESVLDDLTLFSSLKREVPNLQELTAFLKAGG
ncbi:MAG: hypothetical protein N2376_13450, partial [Clostridia bacterium]|nr:hypothetical protein [Clostridia bacterium]